MKLDLKYFPKHNWIIKKDTSHSDKVHLKWSKLKCDDCGTVLDCFFDIEEDYKPGHVNNSVHVYYIKNTLNSVIEYKDENVERIKESIYSCSELIIKNIVE